MSIWRRGLKMPPPRKSASVKAGVFGGPVYPSVTLTDARTGRKYTDPRAGMQVATIAQSLEFGTAKTPARPFMQQTATRDREEWKNIFIKLMCGGADLTHALMTVGQLMKEDIQFTINAWPADNSPEWAAQKGFNKGLVQTSYLLKSIDFKINLAS